MQPPAPGGTGLPAGLPYTRTTLAGATGPRSHSPWPVATALAWTAAPAALLAKPIE